MPQYNISFTFHNKDSSVKTLLQTHTVFHSSFSHVCTFNVRKEVTIYAMKIYWMFAFNESKGGHLTINQGTFTFYIHFGHSGIRENAI